MARHYTVGERAIITIGVQAGQSLEAINTVLTREQHKTGQSHRLLNESSYKIVKTKYFPSMSPQDVWKYIQNPQTLGDLSRKT